MAETINTCEIRIREKDKYVENMTQELEKRETDMKNLLERKLKEGNEKQKEFALKLRGEFQSVEDGLLEKLQITK